MLLVQGCSGIWLGGTLTSAYFASSFGSISESKKEYALERKIEKDLKAIKSLRENDKFSINAFVLKNTIYMVGMAENQSSKKYPMDFIATKYSRYKIMDEVKIGTSKSFSDAFTTQKIKTKLIFTNGVRYANYHLLVYAGEVTIVGYASDKNESTKVLEKISSTRGVKKVINYIEIKDLGD
jgi:osmotically-inducible protein OsmY